MWVLIVEGLVIGCLLGLTGAGGGILAVPALMASQGWSVAQAAPVGLLAITFSAFIGAFQGLLQKIVRYRAALWIALMSIPFAHIGVVLSHLISTFWLTIGFSCVMVIVAYRIFFNHIHDLDNPPCKINQNTGRLLWNTKTAMILGTLGAVAGLLTGMLGVGGGFVIVPALRKVTNLDLRSIIATSLMIIFLIGGVSIVMHLLDGYRYPVSISIIFGGACLIGLIVGRSLIQLIPVKWVQKIFAVSLILVSSFLLSSLF